MKKIQQNKFFNELLNDDKFIHWLINPTEDLNEYWNVIMMNDSEKQQAINKLKDFLKEIKVVEKGLPYPEKREMWEKIEKSTSSQNKRFNFFKSFYFMQSAAVLLLSLFLTSLYIFVIKNDDTIDYKSIADNLLVENKENISIILPNNEKIEVDDKNVDLVYYAEGKMLINSKEIITSPLNKGEDVVNFNQLYVPYGKTTSIVMSDGSKIWVNSGSKLIYPAIFAADRREIYVEGEIYLEVAKMEESPFIVRTDLLEVKVLGTCFNVSAYKNDKDQSVVLATGVVTVKKFDSKTPIVLKPNQKYTFEKSTSKYDMQGVDVLDYIGWKYGFLNFKTEKLSTVLKKVERFYNIGIEYTSDVDNISVSGKLDLKDNIEETFKIISIAAPIDYKIEENGVQINIK